MKYDARFPRHGGDLGGNQLIRETLARVRGRLHMYRLYHHAGQAAATKPEHVAIAAAISAGDPELAASAMENHLRTAMYRLDAVFAAGGGASMTTPPDDDPGSTRPSR